MALISEIDVDIIMNLTWFNESIAEISSDITLMLYPISSTYSSVLTLSPLSAMYRNISCSAYIVPFGNSSLFLIESPIQSVTKSLVIESKFILNQLHYTPVKSDIIVDPAIDITITSNREVIRNIDEKFNITCSVSGLDSLSINPSFAYQWFKDNKVVCNSSMLLFPSFTLSNAGNYTCKVNVSSSYFNAGNVIRMKSYSLFIRHK